MQIENNTFFEINNATGIIKTKAALDFEAQKVHQLVIFIKKSVLILSFKY